MVTIAELAEILGVSKTQARHLADRTWRSYGVAYVKRGPGDVIYPLEPLLAAIAAQSRE